MSKLISIGIFSVIASISLASCSGGGKGNQSNSQDSNKPSGDENHNNPQPKPDIAKESCFDILNPIAPKDGEAAKILDSLKNTKATLCNNIEERLNKGDKPVNAYSSLWDANIQLATNEKPQNSFNQILSDGTFMPLWGIGQWFNNDETLNNNPNPKVLAFGEAKASFETATEFDFDVGGKVEKRKWGPWDIRFIDSKGIIWKANEDGGKGYVVQMAKYAVEADLTEEYVKSVYSVFALPETGEVVFLKKVTKPAAEIVEGTVEKSEFVYDIKKYNEETKKYDDISPDQKTSGIFPMIPEADIASIDYIQKLPGKQLALYKKSPDGKNYLGYYLISSDDLKKENSKVTFVAAIDDFQKNCTEVNKDKKCVFVNEKVSNIFDSGNIALEAKNGSVAYIIPTQENATGPTSLIWSNSGSYSGKTSDIFVTLVNKETGNKEKVVLTGRRLLLIDGMANEMNAAVTSYNSRVGNLEISFDKKKNQELKAGKYTGEFTVQAKGWHDKTFTKDLKVLVSIEQK